MVPSNALRAAEAKALQKSEGSASLEWGNVHYKLLGAKTLPRSGVSASFLSFPFLSFPFLSFSFLSFPFLFFSVLLGVSHCPLCRC